MPTVLIDTLFQKIITILTEPVQLILLGGIAYLARENYKSQLVIAKLLQAQQDRGIVLTKIVTMVEALFNDSRRPK